ncbi:MAG: hypothetical protein KKG60_02935 [Nanoarchaeota archaeon]|nr:hypothetical protein [Nanoarchaeota archaeon]
MIFVIVIIAVLFLILEISCMVIVGKRLIVEVEENGLYYFKPNQDGWYSHRLRVPSARINNIGARGEDIELDLLNTTKKYIFLGDSFTFGWELSDEQTISSYFLKGGSFDDNQVINYGNGGFGVYHMEEMYNFHNNLFNKGDIVVMVLIEADFYRLMVPYEESFVKEVFWKIREKSSLVSFLWASLRHMMGGFKEDGGFKGEGSVFEENGDNLLEFNEAVEEKGQKLVYVFYEYDYTDYSAYARDFCHKKGLFCITDVPSYIDVVRNRGGEVYAADAGHPSAESNEEVAKRITNFINYEIN